MRPQIRLTIALAEGEENEDFGGMGGGWHR